MIAAGRGGKRIRKRKENIKLTVRANIIISN